MLGASEKRARIIDELTDAKGVVDDEVRLECRHLSANGSSQRVAVHHGLLQGLLADNAPHHRGQWTYQPARVTQRMERQLRSLRLAWAGPLEDHVVDACARTGQEVAYEPLQRGFLPVVRGKWLDEADHQDLGHRAFSVPPVPAPCGQAS